jgi:hypothetical protein
VPTPFYHLSLAEELIHDPGISEEQSIRLRENWPDFLLGNTAPDVQTISGQARRLTHFFDLPIRSKDPLPWEKMRREYPGLSRLNGLPAHQAVFLAGYYCHLQADWIWVRQIFVPIFGLGARWKTLHQRLYLHNVLRAYLDFQHLPELPENIGMQLGFARPAGWLPFVEDPYLLNWRDYLSRQLAPGAAVHTVEVFASRQGIAPGDYYSLLESEERLEIEIFSHLPRQAILEYRGQVLAENITLLRQLFC